MENSTFELIYHKADDELQNNSSGDEDSGKKDESGKEDSSPDKEDSGKKDESPENDGPRFTMSFIHTWPLIKYKTGYRGADEEPLIWCGMMVGYNISESDDSKITSPMSKFVLPGRNGKSRIRFWKLNANQPTMSNVGKNEFADIVMKPPFDKTCTVTVKRRFLIFESDDRIILYKDGNLINEEAIYINSNDFVEAGDNHLFFDNTNAILVYYPDDRSYKSFSYSPSHDFRDFIPVGKFVVILYRNNKQELINLETERRRFFDLPCEEGNYGLIYDLSLSNELLLCSTKADTSFVYDLERMCISYTITECSFNEVSNVYEDYIILSDGKTNKVFWKGKMIREVPNPESEYGRLGKFIPIKRRGSDDTELLQLVFNK